ncbi:DUF7316 family protein [Zhihengliuella halotolerans]|uniref:DUF7316 family protein n=1 Tax=Zhihengliuella halotolerans TaxID=370736 RepID=UPI000C805030|nr:hypothetical protein [Zhihengliuella halotolerans]
MTTLTTVKMGLQFPDGTVQWADSEDRIRLQVGPATFALVLDPAEDAKAALVDALCRRAESAKVSKSEFVGAHRVLSQTTVTQVNDPVVEFVLEVAEADKSS